jgi:hypothetical protein
MPPPPAPIVKKARDGLPPTPSKDQIEPFVDEEPGTTKFVPFQDEVFGSLLGRKLLMWY